MKIEHLTQKTETRVLVVDDDEFNRLLLTAPLERLDYQVREAENGKIALDVVAEGWAPDLILLDMMMPEIDGLEVCKRLKGDPDTRIIPIIMVTAMDETELRMQAIECGADDFLTKPIDLHEVLLRVNNAIRMKKLYDEVQQSYRELEKLQQLKVDLTGMIVHDIRSPLSVIQGHMELLVDECADKMSPEQGDWFRIALASVNDINRLSMTLLTQQKMETGELPVTQETIDLTQVGREVLDSFRALSPDRTFELVTPSESVLVRADPELLPRVLHNLLSNARKFTDNQSTIRLRIESHDKQVALHCEDTGAGIAPELLESLFDKYSQGDESHRQMGVGLGLAFCKMATEAMQGSIAVTSTVGEGTTFTVTLPA